MPTAPAPTEALWDAIHADVVAALRDVARKHGLRSDPMVCGVMPQRVEDATNIIWTNITGG